MYSLGCTLHVCNRTLHTLRILTRDCCGLCGVVSQPFTCRAAMNWAFSNRGASGRCSTDYIDCVYKECVTVFMANRFDSLHLSTTIKWHPTPLIHKFHGLNTWTLPRTR